MTALIEVKKLRKYFPLKNRQLQALEDVSFTIFKGETLAVVGESGSGKSTLGKTLLRLLEPTSGEIYFEGKNLSTLSPKDLRPLRQKMQIIFQDPFSSLNPRMTMRETLMEALELQNSENLQDQINKLIEQVGLPANLLDRYPHELSGGQRQRAGIARALAVNPSFIVCDEPLSALDVSFQAQIVNLLIELQKKRTLTYLFISHDLHVVEYIAKRIAVMYLGSLVEIAETKKLLKNPLHPYTEMLVQSSVYPLGTKRTFSFGKNVTLKTYAGDPPSPLSPPKGCVFCTRCPKAHPRCFQERPVLKEVENGRQVACHLY